MKLSRFLSISHGECMHTQNVDFPPQTSKNKLAFMN